MSSQYGELPPTSGWDRFGSLEHPSNFQRFSRLGSVTARHSSSRREPNFAALNRRRHLYSAGRPSRCALAHILVTRFFSFCCVVFPVLLFLHTEIRACQPKIDSVAGRRVNIDGWTSGWTATADSGDVRICRQSAPMSACLGRTRKPVRELL